MTAEINVKGELIGTNLVIVMPELVDIQVTRDHLKYLETMFENNSIKSIVLNTEIDFQLSSVCFGFIMTVHNFSRKQSLKLKMVCNKDKVLKMFDMLKIGHLFDVYPDLNSATAE